MKIELVSKYKELSDKEIEVLRVLSNRNRTMSELATELELVNSAITDIVGFFEIAGLIKSKRQGKYRVAALTKAGKGILKLLNKKEADGKKPVIMFL